MGTLSEAEFLALNENPVTQKLMTFLSSTRSAVSLDGKSGDYIIKKRLVGESRHNHCHTKMLFIKEVKSNGNDEIMLSCHYEFCPKCGVQYYDDGQSSRNLSNF